jgi:mycobactin salicyl-AMP ligase
LVVPSAEHLPGHRLGLAEIREFLSGRDVAAFMLPDEVRTVSSLPLTAIGKVDKKALRAEIEAR